LSFFLVYFKLRNTWLMAVGKPLAPGQGWSLENMRPAKIQLQTSRDNFMAKQGTAKQTLHWISDETRN